MVFTLDYTDAGVREWYATSDGGVRTELVTDYTPSIYVSTEASGGLADLEDVLAPRSDVVGVARERWRTAWRNDPEPVLRLDVSDIDRVRPLAGWIRRLERPGTYRLYNVDFSRQFRYCLERDRDPTPARELRSCTLLDPTPGQPTAPLEKLVIEDETVEGGPAAVLSAVQRELAAGDPDVLVCSSAALVPALFDTAEAVSWRDSLQPATDGGGAAAVEAGGEFDTADAPDSAAFRLGRRPGYEQLATASTYESYGQVGHSPARYHVPGRVVLDLSNTFFYTQTNLEGCLDLVRRSGKPLEELAWASIGNVLTAMQIHEALGRGVLVPWKSWRHEFPKSMRTLKAADRGGFTFSPRVGVHTDVHELDFSSLYPNIICTYNVSPDVIACDCHADREDVPELGYSICDERGYLQDVLQDLIDDRDEYKAAIEATEDEERRAALQGRADAIKWILVSCFGYQGFSNAKFGRIECHEAINAFAREILLDAKERLEDARWRVVHGIVDSLWVTACEDADQRPLPDVAAAVSEATDIRLEYESAYDWLAFVPLRGGEAGALTKYFGKRADGGFKYRGIECRQRSTPTFVADCQRDLIATYDEHRDPEAVCSRLATWVDRLEAGTVDPADLAIRRRASKDLGEYTQATRTVAALARASDQDLGNAAGQDVTFVVVDDDRRDRERVRLAHEAERYDAAFYRERLCRAAESVLSPMGWRQDDIEATLADREAATLDAFGG